ncbi:Chromodomain-helicase-DNA-binding protein 1-like [Polyrhizophydium stewartii]|uniref:Chromodomain-helicase-DNA-binding protein 1-like n=1 Tax=Polyrhizophydium stewartii TaxID=2732419 RepID=A0ABR4N5Z9_9FUNG
MSESGQSQPTPLQQRFERESEQMQGRAQQQGEQGPGASPQRASQHPQPEGHREQREPIDQPHPAEIEQRRQEIERQLSQLEQQEQQQKEQQAEQERQRREQIQRQIEHEQHAQEQIGKQEAQVEQQEQEHERRRREQGERVQQEQQEQERSQQEQQQQQQHQQQQQKHERAEQQHQDQRHRTIDAQHEAQPQHREQPTPQMHQQASSQQPLAPHEQTQMHEYLREQRERHKQAEEQLRAEQVQHGGATDEGSSLTGAMETVGSTLKSAYETVAAPVAEGTRQLASATSSAIGSMGSAIASAATTPTRTPSAAERATVDHPVTISGDPSPAPGTHDRCVVVCLDGSTYSEDALRWALSHLVNPARDVLHLVTVLPRDAYVTEFTRMAEDRGTEFISQTMARALNLSEADSAGARTSGTDKIQSGELRDESERPILRRADDIVQQFCQETGCGKIRTSWNLIEGTNAKERLVEYCRDHHASLAVVGSRGRSTVTRLLLGSVSDYLNQRAPCAVAVVQPGRQAQQQQQQQQTQSGERGAEQQQQLHQQHQQTLYRQQQQQMRQQTQQQTQYQQYTPAASSKQQFMSPQQQQLQSQPQPDAGLLAKLKAVAASLPSSLANSSPGQAVQQSVRQHLDAGVSLRPYQATGVEWLAWLHSQGLSGILGELLLFFRMMSGRDTVADVATGLGKTLQSIAFVAHLVLGTTPAVSPVLVAVPLSLLDNWAAEFSRFAPAVKVLKLRGTAAERVDQKAEIAQNPFHVLLTTFETVLSETDFVKGIRWKYIIVDEAHRLKNAVSLLHMRMAELDCKNRLLLTGTPVQNNLTELQALLSFANPSIFGSSVCDFEGWFGSKASKTGVDELTELLKPFILRRVKEDVLDLPKMKEIVVQAPLTKVQRKLYLSILSKDWSIFDNKQAVSLRNVLMQLRKCVSHPYLFDGVEPEPFVAGEHLVESSGKLKVLDQLLKYAKARGKRVLVFSQATHLLDIVQDYLTFRKFSYERLDGSVRGEERYLSVNQFQTGDSFVFLLSTRAGGVGLNLTAADTVIFLDVDFNPAMDQQAAARVHRIGQTKETTIVRIICPDTVDEVIWRRAQRKLKLQRRIMSKGTLGMDATAGDTWTPQKSTELVSLLQFGIDKIMKARSKDEDGGCTSTGDGDDANMDHPILSTEQLEAIFSPAKVYSGSEMSVDDVADGDPGTSGDAMDANQKDKGKAARLDEEGDADDSIYLYEGHDYKAAAHALSALRQQTAASSPRLPASIRKRRVGAEDDEDYAKRLAERREQAEQRKRERRFAKFAEANYESCGLDFDGYIETADGVPDEDEAEGGPGETASASQGMAAGPSVASIAAIGAADADDDDAVPRQRLRFAAGDATRPQVPPNTIAIIVHVVDDSGSWPNLGVFRSLTDLSPSIKDYYVQSADKDIKNLTMGSAHLVSVPSEPYWFVALVVAQKSTARDRIELGSLEAGLLRVARAAKRTGATVHLPRIGHNLPKVDWYTIERTIDKVLARNGIPTTIYYFRRSRT